MEDTQTFEAGGFVGCGSQGRVSQSVALKFYSYRFWLGTIDLDFVLTGLERVHCRVGFVAAHGGARGRVTGEVVDVKLVAGSERLRTGCEGGECEGEEDGEVHCCVCVCGGGLEIEVGWGCFRRGKRERMDC